MYLFYSENISNNKLSLDESKHCILSLRKKKNDKILITEGKGIIYIAEIIQIHNNQVEYTNLSIIKKNKKKIKSHIVISPPKNRVRFEWFLEKVTELGVDMITPIICENSERKKLNKERSQKILISAMKQSKSAFLPKMNNLIKFKDLLQTPFKDTYIAHCHNQDINYFHKLICTPTNDTPITLFIGPEGDFSKKEINFAEKAGIIPVQLGDQVLRTETAGIVGCSIINLLK